MKRFMVAATVWAMGLAWVVGGGASVSASAQAPAVVASSPVSASGPPAAASLDDGASGLFTPLATARVFDGTATTTPRQVQIAGLGGVPAGATAVVVNTEVFAPTAAGYVRVTPAGVDASVAVQEFGAGQAISNLVVVKLVGGKIQVKVSAGSARILMDVSGYYSAGAGASFTPLSTARVFDGTVTTTPRQVQIAGLGGVPAGATAVVVNTEVFAPTAAGYVRVTPAGLDPNVAVQEFARGQAISNLVVVKLVGGKIQVKVSAGSARILMDVSGYYSAGAGASFTPLSTARVFDGMATTSPRQVQIAGLGGVPAGATAVVVNTEVFNPTAAGYVRVTPAGLDPNVAVQEFARGQAISNLVVVKLVGGKVQVKVSAGSARILMDVSGYYSATIRATAISAGFQHSCAITAAGGVKCWGLNAFGALGNGTATAWSTVPVDVVGLGSGVVAVSASESSSCAVTIAGAVKCWGYNYYGQLGNGTTTSSTVPVGVVGLGSGAVAVSASWWHSCAVTSAGTVKCWGHNHWGELGNGTTTDSAVPVSVVGLSSVVRVSAGVDHSCAVTLAGAVKCWGFNGLGGLGNGTTTNSSIPVGVAGLDPVTPALEVSGGDFVSCTRTSVGAALCWGYNGDGALGNGTTTNSWVAVGVFGLGSGASRVSAGYYHACAVTTGGAVKCWGDNEWGQQGNGTTANSSVPVSVAGLASGVAVSAGYRHSCALLSAGTVRCWGYNGDGELGNGTTTNSLVPVSVVGLG